MQSLRFYRFHTMTWFYFVVNRSTFCIRRSPSVVFGRHIMSTACSGSSCDEWRGFTVDYHVSRKCRLPRVFRFVSIGACLRLQSTAACFAAVERNACFLLFVTCFMFRRQLQLPTAKCCSCVAKNSVFRCCQPQRITRNVFITTRMMWNL